MYVSIAGEEVFGHENVRSWISEFSHGFRGVDPASEDEEVEQQDGVQDEARWKGGEEASVGEGDEAGEGRG